MFCYFVWHFREEDTGAAMNKHIEKFDEELEALTHYHWPGNVRDSKPRGALRDPVFGLCFFCIIPSEPYSRNTTPRVRTLAEQNVNYLQALQAALVIGGRDGVSQLGVKRTPCSTKCARNSLRGRS